MASAAVNLPSIHEMLPDSLLFPETVQRQVLTHQRPISQSPTQSHRQYPPQQHTSSYPSHSYHAYNHHSSAPVAPSRHYDDAQRGYDQYLPQQQQQQPSEYSSYNYRSHALPPLSPPSTSRRQQHPSPTDAVAAPRRSRANTTSSTSSSLGEEDDGGSADNDTEDASSRKGGRKMVDRTKKHACTRAGCTSRFSRPSSLRIHENTHTGARPYKCTWPTCTKDFSVNSNMKRHYKVHLEDEAKANALASAKATGRVPPELGLDEFAALAVQQRRSPSMHSHHAHPYDQRHRHSRHSRTRSFPEMEDYSAGRAYTYDEPLPPPPPPMLQRQPSSSSLTLSKATWEEDSHHQSPAYIPSRTALPSFQQSHIDDNMEEEVDEHAYHTLPSRTRRSATARRHTVSEYPRTMPPPPPSSARRYSPSTYDYRPAHPYVRRETLYCPPPDSPYQAPLPELRTVHTESDVRSQRR